MTSVSIDNDALEKMTLLIGKIHETVGENPDLQIHRDGYLPSKRGGRLEIQFLDSFDEKLSQAWSDFVRGQGGEADISVDLQNGVVLLQVEYKKRFRLLQSIIILLLLPVLYYYLTKINPERYLFL